MLDTARTIALAAALGIGAMAGPVVAAEPATLSLIATGEVAAVPDMATVQVGVTTEGETAAEALSENSAMTATVIATLTAAGIAERDIRTSNFSVSPVYADRKSYSAGEPRIIAYSVNNSVTVRVRDMAALGPLLDSLVSAGANAINQISFGVAEPGPLVDEARRRAVAEAKRRAALYAEAAGVTLGPILSISEPGSEPRPEPMGMTMAMERSAVPIAAGEMQISAAVRIVWQIAQPSE